VSSPNFLMLVVDQERRWDLTLPLLHEDLRRRLWERLRAHRWLAANGVSFANHYASAIPCSPARAGLYTGFHAPDTQIINVMEFMSFSLGVYNPQAPRATGSGPATLGHMLSHRENEAGPDYYCAYKGKWHIALDTDLKTPSQMENSYGFKDWTPHDTAYFDAALAGAHNERCIAVDAADWLTETAPRIVADGRPWFLAVNMINPHDVQYAALGSLPPGLPKTLLGIAPIPNRPPYFDWWNPGKPPNFGPPPGSADPRPFAIDGFAGVLSVAFGNIPFDDDHLCTVCTASDETRQVPMWQAYLNYYINCMVDVDEKLWTVIEAFCNAGPRIGIENTRIIYLGDHGEQAMSQAGESSVYNGARGGLFKKVKPIKPAPMPLRSKGSLLYEESAHVPLIFAAAPVPASWLPDEHRGTQVKTLSSHVDIVPTVLDLAGKRAGWYERTYGHYLSELAIPLKPALPGTSLAAIVADPCAYRDKVGWDDGKGNGRHRALITGDALDTFDPIAAWAAVTLSLPDLKLHVGDKAIMRAMVAANRAGDGVVKFGRWFSMRNYAEQADMTGDYQKLHTPECLRKPMRTYLGQDVQVFDLHSDPHELRNLATAKRIGIDVQELSTGLRDLMTRELSGPGRTPLEAQKFMPKGLLPHWLAALLDWIFCLLRRLRAA
jgi:arylsulfatase A-like enzyme